MRMLIIALLLSSCSPAFADSIPTDARRWQRDLTHFAQQAYGLQAPVSTLAAMIHQESRWRPNAISPAGAQGLAQFMPSTASWMPSVYPGLSSADPFDPRWSMRAMVLYTHWLHKRISAADTCEQWAFVLSAYNGGIGWIARDQKLARAAGDDPQRWFGHVERHNAGRSAANHRENRHYPAAILLTWSPLYYRAGWGPAVCAERWPA